IVVAAAALPCATAGLFQATGSVGVNCPGAATGRSPESPRLLVAVGARNCGSVPMRLWSLDTAVPTRSELNDGVVLWVESLNTSSRAMIVFSKRLRVLGAA